MSHASYIGHPPSECNQLEIVRKQAGDLNFFSSAGEAQQKKRNTILSRCSPSRSFDLGWSTEDSNEHTDVKVHTDRQQWNNIALVAVGTKIQAVQDNS